MNLSYIIYFFCLISAVKLHPLTNLYNGVHESPSEENFSTKCTLCHGIIESLKIIYERNSSSTIILKAAIFFCKNFAEVDPWICRGITSQFQDTFLYVLEKLVFRPSQLCGLLLTGCGTPYNPFDDDWNLPLPPRPPLNFQNQTDQSSTSESEQPLRFIQLSDIHFDFDYMEGSEANCSYPICCNEQNSKNGLPNINREVESAQNVQHPAGYWGTLLKCDSPYRTVENLFQHLNHSEKVDFVLLSGDYMSHADWSYSRAGHLSTIANLTSLINTHLPDTPVYWTLGNHEGVPVNSFAPHFAPEKFRPQWIYEAVLSAGRKYLPKSVDDIALYRGSYSTMLRQNLKLISLNTGYCETTNFFLYLNQTDPDETLYWMIDELHKSEISGQSVYVLAHIPPGNSECLEGWARNYYRIVNRFNDTIMGQFFGHVHTDSFTVFFEDMNDRKSFPSSMLYISPSITTYFGLNPAYRIYEADPKTFQVLDHETHFFNISTVSSPNPSQPPKWELLYKAKEEYGLADLSAKSWANFIDRVEKDETVRDKFLRNHFRRDDFNCDQNCFSRIVCSMYSGHHNATSLCPQSENVNDHKQKYSLKTPNEKGKNYDLESSEREQTGGEDGLDWIKMIAKKAIWRKISSWVAAQ